MKIFNPRVMRRRNRYKEFRSDSNSTAARPGDNPQKCSLLGSVNNSDIRAKAPTRQPENADLREIKLGSIWHIGRTAREHVDRLLWALEQEDDTEVRDQCRAAVSHIKAVLLLVNDLNGEAHHG
jgi:hypothetical protein